LFGIVVWPFDVEQVNKPQSYNINYKVLANALNIPAGATYTIPLPPKCISTGATEAQQILTQHNGNIYILLCQWSHSRDWGHCVSITPLGVHILDGFKK